MPEVTYSPGPWPTAIGRAGTAMFGEGGNEFALRAFREARSVVDVVALLSSRGLADLPDFACAQVDRTHVRVFVRGAFAVVVETDGDLQETSGAGVATWTEVVVPLASGTRVTLGGDSADGGDAVWPVARGVVLAGRVTLDVRAVAEVSASNGEVSRVVESAPRGEPEVIAEAEAEVAAEAEAEVAAEAEAEVAADPESEVQPDVLVPPVGLASPSAMPLDPQATIGDAEEHRFDAMFGHTVPGRRLEDAAVREDSVPDLRALIDAAESQVASEADSDLAVGFDPEATETWAGDLDEQPGDHDGRTMSPAELAGLRARAGQRNVVEASNDVTEPRATVVLSTGPSVSFTGSLTVGRAPKARSLGNATSTDVLVVDNPYVSGTHLELTFDGTSLTGVDVSSNGTLITRPNDAAEVMLPGQSVPVPEGSVLQLTDGLFITVSVVGR